MRSSPVKQRPQRNFRPWPENQLQFEFAERMKFNVSELLNEVVAKYFKRHLAAKSAATEREVQRQFGAVPSPRSKVPKLSKQLQKARN